MEVIELDLTEGREQPSTSKNSNFAEKSSFSENKNLTEETSESKKQPPIISAFAHVRSCASDGSKFQKLTTSIVHHIVTDNLPFRFVEGSFQIYNNRANVFIYF